MREEKRKEKKRMCMRVIKCQHRCMGDEAGLGIISRKEGPVPSSCEWHINVLSVCFKIQAQAPPPRYICCDIAILDVHIGLFFLPSHLEGGRMNEPG